jgi:hypothetical protein
VVLPRPCCPVSARIGEFRICRGFRPRAGDLVLAGSPLLCDVRQQPVSSHVGAVSWRRLLSLRNDDRVKLAALRALASVCLGRGRLGHSCACSVWTTLARRTRSTARGSSCTRSGCERPAMGKPPQEAHRCEGEVSRRGARRCAGTRRAAPARRRTLFFWGRIRTVGRHRTSDPCMSTGLSQQRMRRPHHAADGIAGRVAARSGRLPREC